MPTVGRKIKEAGRRAAAKALDEAIESAPPHVQARLGRPSKVQGAWHTPGRHNAGWVKYDEQGQQLPKAPDPDELGANRERYERKQDKALAIRARHPDLWGKHGTAKIIAYEEGEKVRNIQRYMKEFPL